VQKTAHERKLYFGGFMVDHHRECQILFNKF